MWSYGILGKNNTCHTLKVNGSDTLVSVWEIVAGKEPHADEDQLFVGVKIRDEAFHPPIPDNCDPVLREVMEMCWKKDPADRPVSLTCSFGSMNNDISIV